MTRYMQRQGHKCGRHRVRRLMRLMRLVPIYQTPNTRCPATHACMCERGQETSAAQDLPISAEEIDNWSIKSGVVCGHHLHSDAARVPLFGRHYGLVQSQGFELAFIKQYGGGFLRRGPERGHRQIRQARDYEQPLSCIAAQYPAGQWIKGASSPASNGRKH